jgi:hypothetical protein
MSLNAGVTTVGGLSMGVSASSDSDLGIGFSNNVAGLEVGYSSGGGIIVQALHKALHR